MFPKLLVNVLNVKKHIYKFNGKVHKNYNGDSDNWYILEVAVEYCKHLHSLHDDLPFLPKRMKIKICNKLICNLYDKNNYVIQIRTLKQALNHDLIFKKVLKAIQFNQKT